MVLVVEREPAAHHFIHHHAKAPPVHCTTIVVVFQHLQKGREKALEDIPKSGMNAELKRQNLHPKFNVLGFHR